MLLYYAAFGVSFATCAVRGSKAIMLNGLSTVHGGAAISLEEPKTLVSGAYAQLRRDIIEGRLQPGSKLRVEHLKNNYSVGAGTLREAMALLAADALVIGQGQRGFRVAPISIEDFLDITETRVTLECRALRLSIEQGGDQWEASLSAAYHLLALADQRLKDDDAEAFNAWETANKRFHAALVGESRSRWTEHFLNILYNQAERYRRLLLINTSPSRGVKDEHKAIFETTIARDADRAAELLAKHIRYSYELLREMLAQRSSQTATRSG